MLMIFLCFSLSFFFSIITGTLGTVSCCLRCCFYEFLHNRMLTGDTEMPVREIPASYIVDLSVAEN
jgi:hypothetical protein